MAFQDRKDILLYHIDSESQLNSSVEQDRPIDSYVQDLSGHRRPVCGEAQPRAAQVILPTIPPTPPAPSSRKLWKIPAKIILLGGAVAVVYWKRTFLQNASPYIPVVIPSLILFSQIIFKDWNNYKHRWVRWLLLSCAVGGVAWGIVYQNQQIKDKAAAKTRAEAAEKAQRDNTQLFLGSLQDLDGKVNELQTKIATEPLRRELASAKENIASVTAELQKTEAALAPAPKAALLFSLPGFQYSPTDKTYTPVLRMGLDPTADGVVTVPINIINTTETDALQGHINFFICDGCKYAKEPLGMTKILGTIEQLRDLAFPQILAADAAHDINIDIIVPKGVRSFEVAVMYRCHTCILDREGSKAVINVNWPPVLRMTSPMRFLPSFHFTPEPPTKKK